MKRTKHFEIYELVCPDVYERDGNSAFRYFRPVLLDFLDWLRETLNRPVYVNNWYWGGNMSQRGLRCNMCNLVKNSKGLYLSAHIIGAGVDFNVKGMSPDEVRTWLQINISDFFSKHPAYKPKCRIESSKYAPTWCHVDFYDHDVAGIIHFIKPI